MSLAMCGTAVAECSSHRWAAADLRMARGVLSWIHVAERARDRDGDRIDVLVYLLWAAVLLVLLRYV